MRRLSRHHKELAQTMHSSMGDIVKMNKCIGSLNNLINTLEINKVVQEAEDSETELESPLHVFRSGFNTDLIKKVDDMLEIELDNTKHLAKKQRQSNENMSDTLEQIDEINEVVGTWENLFNMVEIHEIKEDSENIVQQVRKGGFNFDLIEEDKKLVDRLKALTGRLKKNSSALETMWPNLDDMIASITQIDYVS